MAKKLNLARINKKEEDISKNEMNLVNAGAEGGPVCDCDSHGGSIVYSDLHLADHMPDCDCASIWVVFGMMLGPDPEV